MKKLRHKIGRWLLRDEPAPEVKFVIDATAVNYAIRNAVHRRGDGGAMSAS